MTEQSVEGQNQTQWALLLFDAQDEFEAVLDVGSKSDMDLAALDPAILAYGYRPEVALVQSSAPGREQVYHQACASWHPEGTSCNAGESAPEQEQTACRYCGEPIKWFLAAWRHLDNEIRCASKAAPR